MKKTIIYICVLSILLCGCNLITPSINYKTEVYGNISYDVPETWERETKYFSDYAYYYLDDGSFSITRFTHFPSSEEYTFDDFKSDMSSDYTYTNIHIISIEEFLIGGAKGYHCERTYTFKSDDPIYSEIENGIVYSKDYYESVYKFVYKGEEYTLSFESFDTSKELELFKNIKTKVVDSVKYL